MLACLQIHSQGTTAFADAYFETKIIQASEFYKKSRYTDGLQIAQNLYETA